MSKQVSKEEATYPTEEKKEIVDIFRSTAIDFKGNYFFTVICFLILYIYIYILEQERGMDADCYEFLELRIIFLFIPFAPPPPPPPPPLFLQL